MKKSLALSVSFAALMALSGCQQYLTRSDTISPYSGDAVARNMSNQTIDPWPRYVYDTKIETSGERQSGAIRRYNTVHEEKDAAPQLLQLTPANAPSRN